MEAITFRRWDFASIFVAGVGGVGIPAAVLLGWPIPVGVTVGVGLIGMCLLVMCYVDGPASTITVTPTQVIVSNQFVRYEVPRRLIKGIPVVLSPDIVLEDGTMVPLVAFRPALQPMTGRTERAYRQKVKQLTDAMTAIPEQPGSQAFVARKRIGHIALTVLAFLSFFAGAALMLKFGSSSG